MLGGCNLAALAPGTYLCGDGGTCLPGAVCADLVRVAASSVAGSSGSSGARDPGPLPCHWTQARNS